MLDYSERRAYLTHLLSDHRRLDAKLQEIRGAIESAPAGDADPAGRVVRLLHEVRDTLQSHFHGEDEGGYLDEAVARLPRLSAESDRVQAEHQVLLDQLDQLIEQVDTSPHSDHRFREGLDAFYRRLRQHEQAEDELLREGFGLTDNGEDLIH